MCLLYQTDLALGIKRRAKKRGGEGRYGQEGAELR